MEPYIYIGAKVCIPECDDEIHVGTVTRPDYKNNDPSLEQVGWWVLWEEGPFTGKELRIHFGNLQVLKTQ